jgi:hypothetical protein
MEDKKFTAGQVARELGCSLRSIYRWEESGVIPAATRVERGCVSVRIYSAAEVEEIRRRVHGRLNIIAALQPPSLPVIDSGIAYMEREGFLLPVPPEWQRAFAQAMEYVRKRGCKEIAVIAPDGSKQVFSAKGKRKRARK